MARRGLARAVDANVAGDHELGRGGARLHHPRVPQPFVDALGLERPHLVGHSMGGWMAAELAAFAGERFGRLVL
ncbi:alpha/beta fold hydrolase, partial [Bradyrhizobium sp. PRIMUS42]|uniref:alpha/beta fold hydrolase n=1 Tax=Bradyrhizobium sp. PRIMUS42 TaxID=2908926 RepID=UPI002868017C